MSDSYRSALSGEDLAQFIDRCHDSLSALAPFLDDLNALGGSDFDTGTNAARSFAAIKRMLERSGVPASSASALLQAAVVYSRAGAQGHVGLLITSILAALANVTTREDLRPIDVRAFLEGLPGTIDEAFSSPAPELVHMAEAAREVAQGTPDPINAVHMMVGRASMDVQDALIETTSGWINPGACVLAVMLSALHSVYERSEAPLEVVREMMRSLADSIDTGRDKSKPHVGAQFSVDFHLDCMVEDARAFEASMRERGYRYSMQGAADVLGMGTWRFHIDTPDPSAALPRVGWVRHIVVKDARYGELIGYDELAVQQEASGVLYLSRPTWQRPETVRVIALLRSEDLLEEVAATGAHVVLNPTRQDAVLISELMLSAPAGVCLVLPGDEEAADVAVRAQKLAAQSGQISVVSDEAPFSDVAVSVLATEAAPIFMPQVGERTAHITRGLLESAAGRAKARMVIVEEPDPSTITNRLVQLVGYGLERVLMLGPKPDELLRHSIEMALDVRGASTFVEYVASKSAQVVLVNR
ncbi:MAG: hypothetical protein Q4E01_02995 [Actinomycetaceae bacterium]|nr:hypothetical protein [Actinomycetaceae bacterium]